MLSSTFTAGLLLGLTQIQGGLASPVEARAAAPFTINHTTSNYFPSSKGDLSWFDVDVEYSGFDAATQAWLSKLDPSTAESDEEKAVMMTEAAYAKPYNATDPDPDMKADVESLLAAVAGNTTSSLSERATGSTFKVATAHAVKWGTCGAVLSCLSGATCGFSLVINEAPRSKCQQVSGSTCCISWSNYNIRAGFFSTTWTTCNSEVTAQKRSTASCEGYGSSSQGGDVCLSNRANGCT